MKHQVHPFQSGRLFFLTTVTHLRTPFFGDSNLAEALSTIIREIAAEEKIEVWAYIVMPDHLHLIVDLHESCSLGRLMNLIKGRSSWRLSHTLRVHGPVWQRGYHDHVIRNESDLMIKLRYLLDNPRRAGLPDQYRRPPYLWIREEWRDSVEEAP